MADEPDQEPLPESEIKGSDADDDSARLQTVHDRALRRFDAIAMPQQEQRSQSLEARRFVTIPGAMWEGLWGLQFENSPRPEIDKITKALEKIETDYRENRLTVDFVPGQTADPETANTLDGMHRADSYQFKAQQARDNAFQEAIRGGFGAYRLTTDYANPEDPDDDAQRVNPGLTIVDADQSVYFDGASILYDKSDAKWAFVVTADPRAEAEETWGPENIADWPLDLWKYAWDWFTPDVIRIAEYYETEEVSDKRLTFTQSASGAIQRYFESEIEPKDVRNLKAQGWKLVTKPAKRKRIHKYIMNGSCVLKDCGYIAGPNIPIVPVYFRRDYVDNMERWRGYVGKKMDSQRIFNSANAKLAEIDSLSPFEKPVFDPSQIDAVQAGQWSRSNIDRLPYLTASALRNADGSVAQAGPSFTIKPSEVPQVTVTRLQFALQILSEDDDNADQVKANVSDEAMDIAASRVDAKSGIPLDNMRQSIAREGEIYLGMAREVYFEPGRKVETISMDGQDGEAQLMQPHIDDQGVFRIRNDLTQGSFKVVADVQEATATARGRTVRQCLNAAAVAVKAQDMEMAQAYLLTAAMNQDGEGMQSMQKFARNKAIGIGLEEPTPEEKQQIEQAQQAQQQGQPAPADQALVAQAGKLQSEAQLNQAKAVQTMADADLKKAQAETLDKAPKVPTGLGTPPENPIIAAVDAHAKIAAANLHNAQAQHIAGENARKNAQTNDDLTQGAHDRAMAERQQDHAETQVQ